MEGCVVWRKVVNMKKYDRSSYELLYIDDDPSTTHS